MDPQNGSNDVLPLPPPQQLKITAGLLPWRQRFVRPANRDLFRPERGPGSDRQLHGHAFRGAGRGESSNCGVESLDELIADGNLPD